MHLTFPQILAVTGGRAIAGGVHAVCKRLSTDTRTLRSGDWFVALRGERFDAHDYLPEALERGAGGLVLSRLPEGVRLPPFVAAVLVEDTLAALGAMAGAWRAGLDVNVVAVTGSSGKTTTKDLLRRMITLLGPTLATEGNLNNLIGVPQMLQRLTPRHRWAVLEIGMSFPGEIDTLAAMIGPRIGVITNVGSAHAGNFRDGTRGVFRAKAELVAHLPPGGTLVLNADNQPATGTLAKLARARRVEVVTFSPSGQARADLRVVSVTASLRGGRGNRYAPTRALGQRVAITWRGARETLPLAAYGRYNVANLAAAAAAALVAGVPLARLPFTTSRFTPTGMRSSIRRVRGAVLLADCYNANPESMTAALEALRDTPVRGRRIAVLGDMRELGADTAARHREIGRLVAALGIDHLVTFGPAARIIGQAARGVPSRHFTEAQAATAHVLALLSAGDAVLVKGSRAMAMERIVEALESAA